MGMITAFLAINEEQAKTVRLIFGLFIEGLTPCAIAQRSAKGERLRREASPFRGRGSSGRLRRRESLRVQKRRILRLPRTSTSVCVGGRVR